MIITTHNLVSNQANPHLMSMVPEPKSELEPEPFGGYFETWLQEQDRDLRDLVSAAKVNSESTRPSRSRAESTQFLRELVGRVMSHYESYYRVKSESVKKDVLLMMTPAWRSHLEEAFLWIGGWRPSMAFHLLYSISGLQLEAGLNELLRGLSTGDLGDLTPSQLAQVDDLQRETLREEKALTEALAAHQETLADSSMVELSHLATELIRDPESTAREGEGADSVTERIDTTLGHKEEKLEEILNQADNLRLSTLQKVVAVLSPIQAVHFLIAAAELHLRVHEWGKKKDELVQQ